MGVYKWTSDAESTFVSRCGTVPTILCYSMELYKEYNDALKKAKGDILVDVSFGVVPRQSLEFVFFADVRFSLFIPGIIMTKEMSKRSKKGAPNEMRKNVF